MFVKDPVCSCLALLPILAVEKRVGSQMPYLGI